MLEDGGFWVFGYGSLIWRPGFEHVERRIARLADHRRRFCVRSIRWRGTPEAPGLVLGLDPEPGAETWGVAFRVAPEAAAEVRAYLHHREMGTKSYFERFEAVSFDCGTPAPALVYVMDPTHEQYVRLPLDAQAEIIARAEGAGGPNRDYLAETAAHLRELGLADPELDALDARVRELLGRAPRPAASRRSAP